MSYCVLEESTKLRGHRLRSREKQVALICKQGDKYWIHSCGDLYSAGSLYANGSVIPKSKIGSFPDDQETIKRAFEKNKGQDLLIDENDTYTTLVWAYCAN